MARLRRRPWGAWLLLVLVVAFVVGAAAARLGLTLVPPHVASSPAGIALGDDKKKELDEAIADAMVSDRDRAIDVALDFTGRSLSFSPGHTTSFDFKGTGSRGGNCVEYAELFVVAFDAAAKHAGSTARAFRVRSGARVFGKKIPLAAFADHDWVLVVDPADGARIPLDPTFADAFLGASLARNVERSDAIVLPK